MDLTWKIAGEAGAGIMSAGLLFAKTALRAGYFVYDFNEYPSLIRGGHNTYTVRVSDKEIFSQVKPVNILVALNKESVFLHKGELVQGGAVILDQDKTKEIDLPKGVKVFSIPLIDLAQKAGDNPLLMNSVALGATIALL